jgi:hypothetical protein
MTKRILVGIGLLVLSTFARAQDTFLHDGGGNEIGISVAINGLNLQVQVLPTGVISAANLPTVTMVLDGSGRFQSLSGPSGSLATYAYAADGSVNLIQLPGNLRLESSVGPGGVVTQKVRSSGVLLQQVQVNDGDGHGRWHLMHLDLLLQSLGLGHDWFNTVSLAYNATSSVATVRSSTGAPLFYLLRYGTVSVGFDLSGHGLFYDLDVTPQVVDQALQGSGTPASRIVVTADQRVEVQAPMTVDGAIESLWVDRNGVSGAQTIKTRTVTSVVRLVEAPNVFQYCGHSTETRWNGNNPTVQTYEYYCDYTQGGGGGGGGGCFDCGGGSHGGGGGTQDHNNNHINNSVEREGVNRAMTLALTKLQSAACKNVFSQFTNSPGGHTAQWVLDNEKHVTATAWFNDSMLFYLALPSEAGCNSGEIAKADLNTRVAKACPGFRTYQMNHPQDAADYLIHEELHTLGLGEAPGQPGNQIVSRFRQP